MQLKDVLYTTPEMTEEKLFKIMEEQSKKLKFLALFKVTKNRIESLHKELNFYQALLKEFDLIQEKKSYLTHSQREQVNGFVGLCLIKMTKDES